MSTQREEALKVANERRLAAARFKRDLGEMTMAEGLFVAADLIEQPPEPLSHIKVTQLISAIHQCGAAHADLYCRKAAVSTGARLRALTASSRSALAEVLREHGEQRRSARPRRKVAA